MRGKIEVCGLHTFQPRALGTAPKVGTVFQNPKTNFSVWIQSVNPFACENQGITPDKIRHTLKGGHQRAELTDLITCSRLLNAEKNNVACGSATMLDPDVLVLDEPSPTLTSLP